MWLKAFQRCVPIHNFCTQNILRDFEPRGYIDRFIAFNLKCSLKTSGCNYMWNVNHVFCSSDQMPKKADSKVSGFIWTHGFRGFDPWLCSFWMSEGEAEHHRRSKWWCRDAHLRHAADKVWQGQNILSIGKAQWPTSSTWAPLFHVLSHSELIIRFHS